MEGFIPLPPLPPDEKITVSYVQSARKFVESLKAKDGPLPLPPFKSPSVDNSKNNDEKNRNQSSSKGRKKNDERI